MFFVPTVRGVHGRRLGRSSVKERGLVAGGPQGRWAVPLANGQAVPVVARGVGGTAERFLEGDVVGRRRLGRSAERWPGPVAGGPPGVWARPVAGSQAVPGVACGVEAEKASQWARWADGPQRDPLWDDAKEGGGGGGSTLSAGASARCRLLQVGVGRIRHRWGVRWI